MKSSMSQGIATLSSLVGILLLIKLFDLTVDPVHVYPGRTASFSWLELGLAASATIVAAALGLRSPLVKVWPRSDTAGVLLVAIALGLALGAMLAGIDAWLRIGDINVGLPLAPVFYLWGAITQEILTHFAPIAVVLGILTLIGIGDRGQSIGFWIVAVSMAGLAAVGMAAAFGVPDIPLTANVTAAPIIIAAAVFVVELALFAMLRRQGLIAALTMRLGFYAVWHIAWPAIIY